MLASGKPWPVDLSLEAASARLTLTGRLAWKKAPRVDVAVHVSGRRLAAPAALVGVKLPPVGAFDLSGRLRTGADGVRLSQLTGTLGQTSLGGDLVLALSADRPVLRGTLSFDRLDLAPLYAAAGGGRETPPPAGGRARLPVGVLRRLEVDLKLTARDITGLPGRWRDAALHLALRDGRLEAPLALAPAGVAVAGRLSAAAEGESLVVGLKLHADKADVRQVLTAMTGRDPGLAGTLEAVTLTATARGDTLRGLVEGLDVRLAAAPLRLKAVGRARPVIVLRRFSLTRRAGRGLDVRVAGSLSGEKFDLHLTTANPVRYLDGRPLAVDVRFRGGGAGVRLDGFCDPRPGRDRLRFKVAVEGRRVGDLTAWTGLSPKAAVAYHAAGTLRYGDDRLRLDLGTLRLGRIRAAGRLDYRALRSDRRVFDIRLNAETLDFRELRELAAVITAAPPKAARETPAPVKFAWDRTVLPDHFRFLNGEIHIAAGAVTLAASRITDVAFDILLRDGKMAASPFRATLGDETFRGRVALDFDNEVPSIRFSLDAERVDVGELLRQFGIATPVDVKAARLGMVFALRGRHAIDIMKMSELTVRIENGTWKVSHLGGWGETVIHLSQASYTTAPGKTAVLKARGRIGELPVYIHMREDGMFTHNVSRPFKLTLAARLGETNVRMAARLTLEKIIQSDFGLQLSVSGDRLDRLNDLFGLRLPPWGPYEVSGYYHETGTTAAIENMHVRVGKSRLQGKIVTKILKTRDGKIAWPVRVDAGFTADSIRLDDFKLRGWSLLQDTFPGTGAGPGKTGEGGAETAAAPRQGEGGTVTRLRSLLSPEIARKANGRLTVKVREVLSGADRLGSGSLMVRLRDGRYTVDPLRIDIPGGLVEITGAVAVTDAETSAEIGVQIDRLDYGVLARHIDPHSDMKGWLYLDVSLASRAKNPADLIRHASGHFNFGVAPQKLETGVFDLWAASLVTAVLPILTRGKKSKVNCLVARFDMQDGIMKPDMIMVDTTKVRVTGRGRIDFRKRNIHIRLVPHPKKPQFFNLATPLEINGPFTDFNVDIKTGDILGTAVRFITSAITVPFQWLIYNKLPADGKRACAEAFGLTSGN